MSRPFLFHIGFFLCLCNTKSATEGPVSLTTLEGLNAQFHCAGNDTVLAWEVDGLLSNDQSIKNRNITDYTVTSSGTIQSTLNVPATLVNNGTTVRCLIGPSLISLTFVGNSSTLNILSDIGPVLHLQFESSFSSVLWDPPATAGVLNLLFCYNVIVMNMNTSEVIVSDTTNSTIYPLPPLQSCQYYTANVIVFYKDHFGDSVVTGQRIPDEYFKLHNLIKTMIVRLNERYSDVTFSINIKGSNMSCPGQELMAVTYPISNPSDTTMHKEGTIVTPGEMEFTVTVERGCECACNVLIVTENSSQVDKMKINFSTFDVQGCTVSSDHNSIVLRCIFAINSTAPGNVVVKNRISCETVKERNYRDFGDYPESITIPDLQAGDYAILVYDEILNQTRLAYNESLHITTDDLGSNSGNSSSPTPTLSITTSTDSSFVGVIAGSVVVAATIIIILAILIEAMYLYVKKKHRQKTTPMNEYRWTRNANIYSDENELRRVTPIDEKHIKILTPALAESNYMQTLTEFLSTTNAMSTDHDKKSDTLYAGLQHPSNPLAASVSVDIPQQQQSGLHYAEVQHSNRPAAATSVEPVQYATTVQPQELVNRECSENICAATISEYASEEAGSGCSVSSEAKTETITSTELSYSDTVDADGGDCTDYGNNTSMDADGGLIRESEDCTDYGNKTSMA